LNLHLGSALLCCGGLVEFLSRSLPPWRRLLTYIQQARRLIPPDGSDSSDRETSIASALRNKFGAARVNRPLIVSELTSVSSLPKGAEVSHEEATIRTSKKIFVPCGFRQSLLLYSGLLSACLTLNFHHFINHGHLSQFSLAMSRALGKPGERRSRVQKVIVRLLRGGIAFAALAAAFFSGVWHPPTRTTVWKIVPGPDRSVGPGAWMSI